LPWDDLLSIYIFPILGFGSAQYQAAKAASFYGTSLRLILVRKNLTDDTKKKGCLLGSLFFITKFHKKIIALDAVHQTDR